MSQSIHITAPHTLTQEIAMRRVLAWLQSQQGTNEHVTPVSTVIDNQAHSITLKLLAYGDAIQAAISVSMNAVDVLITGSATGPLAKIAEWGALQFESVTLKQQLTEVITLKGFDNA